MNVTRTRPRWILRIVPAGGAGLAAAAALGLAAALAIALPLTAWLRGVPDVGSLSALPGPRVALNPLRSGFGEAPGALSPLAEGQSGTADAVRQSVSGSCAGYLCGATPIASLPYSASMDTGGESAQPGATACAPTAGATWFHYVPATDQMLMADAGGYPLSLGAFTGTSPDSLQQVTCAQAVTGDAQAGWFPARAGRDVYFQVAPLTGGGSLRFRLQSMGALQNVTLSPAGQASNGDISSAAVTPDGRYVVFASSATDLTSTTSCPLPAAPADPTGGQYACWQVLLRDRVLGTTLPVGPPVIQAATTYGATPAITSAAVSADGRYVAFATDFPLAPQDTNNAYDIYVYDRLAQSLDLESTAYGSLSAAAAPAADYSCVAFQPAQVNQVTNQYNLGCSAPGAFAPSLSADGRYVVFTSDELDLVPGYSDSETCALANVCGPADNPADYCDTTGCPDQVYIRDRVTGQTSMASILPDGSIAESYVAGAEGVSSDGRYVPFTNAWTGLVYVRDTVTHATRLVTKARGGGLPNGFSGSALISADGAHVAFWSLASNLVPGDSNNGADIFEWSAASGAITRVTVSSGGAQQEPPSGGLGTSGASISADGRYVAFGSNAVNLAPESDRSGNYQVYVHDATAGTTIMVSVSQLGVAGNGWSGVPYIDAAGSLVAFESGASNLGAEATCRSTDASGTCLDVLVRELG